MPKLNFKPQSFVPIAMQQAPTYREALSLVDGLEYVILTPKDAEAVKPAGVVLPPLVFEGRPGREPKNPAYIVMPVPQATAEKIIADVLWSPAHCELNARNAERVLHYDNL